MDVTIKPNLNLQKKNVYYVTLHAKLKFDIYFNFERYIQLPRK